MKIIELATLLLLFWGDFLARLGMAYGNDGYGRLALTLCTVDTDTPVSFAISLMEFFPFLKGKVLYSVVFSETL